MLFEFGLNSALICLSSPGNSCNSVSACENCAVNLVCKGVITVLMKLVMLFFIVVSCVLMLLSSTVKAPSPGARKLLSCLSMLLAKPLSAEPWKNCCTPAKLFCRVLCSVEELTARVPSLLIEMPRDERLTVEPEDAG